MKTIFVSWIISLLSIQCWAAADDDLASVRAAFVDKQYASAVSQLDVLIAKGDGQQQDFPLYLKSLAQFYEKDFSNAIQTCEQFLGKYQNSSWYQKAIFLQAQCHIQLKQFKEAEAIYEKETTRLLSAARKEEIASVYVRFAEALSRKPTKDELDAPPPNYQKAYNLYQKAMELEIGRILQDEIKFRLGRMMQLDGNYGQAIQEYRKYLDTFDPDWLGDVDSPRRQKKLRAEDAIQPGKHVYEARYNLAECQLAIGPHQWARINLEDLLKMLPAEDKLIRDSQFLITRTYLPNPQTDELELGVKAAKKFLADFPNDVRSILLAYEIAQAYQSCGRSEDAIQAYQDVVDGKGFSLPNGEIATTKDETGESPAERLERLRMSATYKIGEIRFAQKDYAGAIETWNQYIKQFPNAPQWTDAQQGIINAEFQTGVDFTAEEKYDDAVKIWDEFLVKHPLSPLCRQIMFVYGQIHYYLAEKAASASDKSAETGELQKAIAEWEKLVNKYPNTEESSLALFRIGQIYEEKLADLEKSLESYRRLNWGSWQGAAQQRIAEMTNKKLQLVTERVFRTNEPARVNLTLRNIEKVTVSIYKLNLESYWRKMHGITEIERLDIALIAPNKTWEYQVPNYQKYKLFAQEIEIPMEGEGVPLNKGGQGVVPLNKGGQGVVYAVNIGETDLEATTLVIRSDIDAIIKTSRQEVLIFVEDMLKGQPASKAKVLVSDGIKVICEGETGDDGVFHWKEARGQEGKRASGQEGKKARGQEGGGNQSLIPNSEFQIPNSDLDELKQANQVTVFVIKDGSVASNLLDISGLGLSEGLSPRGYLYTDRPAYRPGQKVSIRGIIRDTKEGVYFVSAGAAYKLSVLDSQGRLIREEEVKLSDFGTFHTEMELDENAPVGEYRIIVQLLDDESKVFTGNFQVQKFQLEKMKLAIDFPQRVYFRGENIEATFTASYYYGAPVANRLIKYMLPNGQSYTEETDAEGKLKVVFDTSYSHPGTMLTFSGSIEGENVYVEDGVYLAHLGFSINVTPSAEVVLSGETFDVSVETMGADGKPVGKELTLTVFRRTEVLQLRLQTAHPILSQIPWLADAQPAPTAEVKMEEHKIVTDSETGKGRLQLSLDKGGVYVLRASGVDRFDQPVSGEGKVTVSDEEDAVKLRIFAERSKFKVGSREKIRIHSRIGEPSSGPSQEGRESKHHALVTFEGEGIISYKILQLKKDWNDVEFDVGHEHFPNFYLAVAVMDGQNIRTAGKEFTVERELVVSIKPSKEAYLPGEDAQVEIRATDQLGKPVKAELSLALVDEALFALYPDNLEPIFDFFEKGTHRDAAMRTISSCTFRYQATTRQAVKEIQEEAKRLEVAAQEEMLRERIVGDARDLAIKEDKLAAGVAVGEVAPIPAAPGEEVEVEMYAAGRRLAVKPKPRAPVVKTIPKPIELESTMILDYLRTTEIKAREESSDAGYWLPAIVTDADGKAIAKIPMPEKTTEWRLTARGCTVETLVGQVKANTITRKDFFVDIKTPSIVTEGDKIRVLARVHNLTDFTGDVDCELTLDIDGKKTVKTKKVNIQKNARSLGDFGYEVVFDEMEISAGKEVKVKVTAKAGNLTDGISRTFPIRPWGMEYADSRGGVSSGNETVFLQLPAERTYTSKRMTISVGPDISRLIFDLTMQKPWILSMGMNRIIPMPSDAGSDLLAAAYALNYVKIAGGSPTDNIALMEYARSLLARIVVTQKDNGAWGWCHIEREGSGDVYVTARTMWALAEARRSGVTVNLQTVEKGTEYLKQAFSSAEQNDDETKAVILHALSCLGQADFAYANRLYRNRNQMSPPALAYTALIFANLNRNEIAGEILDVLEKMNLEKGSNLFKVHETTALVLLAMEAVRPDSPLVKQTVEYLLSKRTFCGYSPYKAKGPVVAALAVYYQQTQFEKSDYRLKISVNGNEIKSAVVRGEQPTILIDVSGNNLADGQNKVEFTLEGRGNYAYAVTLSGFSPEIIDPKSWDRPFIRSRKYYHAPLEYRGRQIASSTTEITQLEDGMRTYVTVDVQEHTSNRYLVIDEYLPAGTMLVEGSVSGNHQYYEVGEGMITFYYPPNQRVEDYRYQLVSYAPGTYRAMPTVIRDAMRPGEMRIFTPANGHDTLAVLAPGEKSKDEYKMNDSELYELGKAHFDDGKYAEAMEFLEKLYKRNQRYNEREVAQMLLWMRTEDPPPAPSQEGSNSPPTPSGGGEKYYDAQKIVEYFEILRERFPELYIPFDKILVVGRAYRDIGEFERAYLVYKATIDASFVNDSNVSAVLQDEGQFLSSIDFQKNLWLQYPDTPQVTSAYFALSQALYSKAPEAEQLSKALLTQHATRNTQYASDTSRQQITKLDILKETVAMLSQFLTLYPEDTLADDATFSMANAFLDLQDFPTTVRLCQAGIKRYPESDYLSSFQYVEALGLFSQRKYDEAVEAAKPVSDGKSKDRDLTRYIIGQIYHAQGKPKLAIEWYEKIKDQYPDAQEAISYFEEKRISLPELNIFPPNFSFLLEKEKKSLNKRKEKFLTNVANESGTEILLKYRNIKEAMLQVYRVDLMKLYLREKDLGKITQVQLAGIEPEVSESITLGDGKDYIDKERKVKLDIKDEGAYLVLCRGDDLFATGLVLITPLDIEVQEDVGSGRVRVNVRDTTNGTFIEGVHVKAIGSADKEFKSGETDLRGIFIADNIRGNATVIARDEQNRYAFYRGKQWLGAPEAGGASAPAKKEQRKAYYRENIEEMNKAIQQRGFAEFDRVRRGGQKGVQVQQAE
jgi:uncharacterized protein YfaS (alpha-2-macroglobulin family)/TolA-binding protein